METYKQTEPRLLCTTANASEDTTLIGAGTNLTTAYRKANLTDNQLQLQGFADGAFVSLCSQVDGDTGTFELWGYPRNGMAQFLGEFTYTTDEAVVSIDGTDYYYVDAFVEKTSNLDSAHAVSIINTSDGVALLQFATLGFEYIVGLITAITSTDADGNAKLFLRQYRV